MNRQLVLLAYAAFAWAGYQSPGTHAQQQAAPESAAGRLLYDGTSQFSHIRIRQRGSIRAMMFVRDAGEEVFETQLDVRQPQLLQFEYLRYFFASYLFREKQEDVLIVGLGGGGMIHFLQRTAPELRVDAVEIDPLVVELADKFFDVRSTEKVKLITADGLKYLAETQKRYDVIYMDAFLKPTAETDGTGAPLALCTQQFYRQMQQKLKRGGLVAFNLNPHPELVSDIEGIEEAFSETYVFPLGRANGAVVIGSTESQRVERGQLVRRAKTLDRQYRQFRTGVHFEEMARRLQR